MRHLNKILNLLERVAKDMREDQEVLVTMHPGTPNVDAGDVRLAREELIALEAKINGTTITTINGQPSGIFVHPETVLNPGVMDVGSVLGNREVRELEYNEVPLLEMKC